MFKNIYLLTALAALSFTSGCSSNKADDIKNTLTHIAQAKKDIVAESNEIASINKQTKDHIKQEACGHMADILHYEEHIKTLNTILNSITSRDEFKRVIDHVTDYQVACIVDKHINYNDIQYTADIYPIEQKSLIQAIDNAVADKSLTRYTNHELIFNVYYLEATQTLGYKLLLEKLDLKTQALETELAALEAHCHN